MSLLDRHILSSWLKAFGLTLGAIVGILLLFDVSDNMKDLLDAGAGLRGITTYYLTLIPSLLPATLPISIMVSILFSLGQLHRNSEITAMRAVGLSLWKITRTLWLAAFLLSALLYHLNATLVPEATEKSRRLLEEYSIALHSQTDAEPTAALKHNLAFHNEQAHQLWYLNRLSPYTGRAYGIQAHQLDPNGRELTRYLATEGYFDDSRGHWVLLNGRETRFDPATGDPIRSLPFVETKLENFRDSPDTLTILDKKVVDLSIRELRAITERLPPEQNPSTLPYLVREHMILAAPAVCLIVVGLAIPFAVSGVRTNPLVGISKSIGLFALYYILSSIAGVLGSRGALDPIFAAWLPNTAALIAALIFTLRAQ